MNALVMTYLTIVGMLLLTTFPLLVPVIVTELVPLFDTPAPLVPGVTVSVIGVVDIVPLASICMFANDSCVTGLLSAAILPIIDDAAFAAEVAGNEFAAGTPSELSTAGSALGSLRSSSTDWLVPV